MFNRKDVARPGSKQNICLPSSIAFDAQSLVPQGQVIEGGEQSQMQDPSIIGLHIPNSVSMSVLLQREVKLTTSSFPQENKYMLSTNKETYLWKGTTFSGP